ncbi:MAG: hypothetical protein JRN35_05600 [Nitrososphaerota archaeon]|nr:hypothetical protein [Nitrososphaerota archaeon]
MTKDYNLILRDSVPLAQDLIALLDGKGVDKIVEALIDSRERPLTSRALGDYGVAKGMSRVIESKLIGVRDSSSKLALAVAIHALQGRESSPSMELCWTGPRVGVPLRSTGPVIEQIILGAKSRILLAEYEITDGAKRILELISDRALAGVRVTFIVDRGEEKGFLTEWATRLPGVEVWSRPASTTDPLSKLHIKSILVDGRVAIFGSANLTHCGLRTNIEMGVVVRDTKVVSIAEEALLHLRQSLVRLVPRTSYR